MEKKQYRRFFIKLILFLPIILIWIFIEYKLYRIENTYNYKKKALISQLKDIKILAVGDSHGLNAFNPDEFQYYGFNLSNHSQSIYYSTSITMKYINKMPNLKCVLLNIGYISLFYEIADARESWREYFYYHFWDIKPIKNEFDIKKYSLVFLYSPKKTLDYISKGFNVKLSSKYKYNGWCDVGDSIDNSMLDDNYAKYISDLQDKEFIKESRFKFHKDILEKFIINLKKRNIKLVFVTTPVSYVSLKYLNPEIKEINLSTLNYFTKKYNNCKYYNYLTDKRFVYSDFSDVHHLNRSGAIKFSRIINNEILKYY